MVMGVDSLTFDLSIMRSLEVLQVSSLLLCVCVCVCACVRACMRTCVRVRACLCVYLPFGTCTPQCIPPSPLPPTHTHTCTDSWIQWIFSSYKAGPISLVN